MILAVGAASRGMGRTCCAAGFEPPPASACQRVEGMGAGAGGIPCGSELAVAIQRRSVGTLTPVAGHLADADRWRSPRELDGVTAYGRFVLWTTTRRTATPTAVSAASASSRPVAPHLACAELSRRVITKIVTLSIEAKMAYFVATAVVPIVSRTKPMNAARPRPLAIW